MELTLHVTINNIPDSYFKDGNYNHTEGYIVATLKEMATDLEGDLYDFEIK